MSTFLTGVRFGAAIRNAAALAWRAHRRLSNSQRRAFRREVARGAERALRQLQADLQSAINQVAGVLNPVMQRLQDEGRALHRLLPKADYRYSVILLAAGEDLESIRASLEACRRLSAPCIELLVGIEGPATRLLPLQSTSTGLRVITANTSDALLSSVVSAARGSYLLFVQAGDWLRPDILYRYELLLRAKHKAAGTIVGCSAHRLGSRGELFGPGVTLECQPHFPLLFSTEGLASGVLIPRQMATSALGKGGASCVLDLVLAAISCGADFVQVPIALRAAPHRPLQRPSDSRALRRYFEVAGLDWQVEGGRVIPRISALPSLQAIVLYRDRRDMTLECVKCLRAQQYPALTVTSVDNASADHTIAATLTDSGVDVMRVDEPFNYSRLNNLAAGRANTELLLFLNNDVLLKAGALAELAAWAIQPPVGLAGPALYFPDGRLQHGGIERSVSGMGEWTWEETEYGWPRDDLVRAARLRVVDAVSGACAVTRRAVFDGVGGFDAVNYPVAFSDTDLSQRIGMRGLACVYTPYAEGVHHESASRRFPRLENFEGSAWFARQLGRS